MVARRRLGPPPHSAHLQAAAARATDHVVAQKSPPHFRATVHFKGKPEITQLRKRLDKESDANNQTRDRELRYRRREMGISSATTGRGTSLSKEHRTQRRATRDVAALRALAAPLRPAPTPSTRPGMASDTRNRATDEHRLLPPSNTYTSPTPSDRTGSLRSPAWAPRSLRNSPSVRALPLSDAVRSVGDGDGGSLATLTDTASVRSDPLSPGVFESLINPSPESEAHSLLLSAHDISTLLSPSAERYFGSESYSPLIKALSQVGDVSRMTTRHLSAI